MTIKQHVFQQTVSRHIEFPYLVYEPATPAPHPLIVYLHGSGERGDDPAILHEYGPNTYLKNKPDFPFLVVSPQCPLERRWEVEIYALEAFLLHIFEAYLVDRTRVYLTGNSMGGYGTWHWAGAQPQYFVALAPICGGGSPYIGRYLSDIPVWAFHGDADSIVDIGESARMVNAVNRNGGNAELTIYAGVEHDSWTQTYLNPELYNWFLLHQKSGL